MKKKRGRLNKRCYNLIYSARKKGYQVETRARTVSIPYENYSGNECVEVRQLRCLKDEFGFGIQSVII